MRVEVNLNALTGDRLVRVRLDHFAHPPIAGARFTAFDPAADLQGPASVVDINEHSGLAYVAVDWDQMRDLSEVP